MKAAILTLVALAPLSLIVSSCGSDGGSPNGDGGINVNRDAAPIDGEPSELSGITSAHNQVRAQATPAPSPALPPLAWSNEVATAAQTWSDNCEFKHGGPGNYGQNIYASTGGTSGPDVTSSWSSESVNYNYANNSCASNKVCGHYTQVVWRNSTELGCGITHCTKNSPWGGGSNAWTLVVCNYNPPGNYSGQKPY